MNKKKWFKIFLWVWLASIPSMLLMGFAGDWAQHAFNPVPGNPTAQQLQAYVNTPRPPIVIIIQMTGILAGLYMFLGWIPVIIFGFLKEAKPKQAR